MEIFYSDRILDGRLMLDADEAAHCALVLRHKAGERIEVIDGRGTLYHCVIEEAVQTADNPSGSDAARKQRSVPRRKGGGELWARIESSEENWGGHPYKITLAVCPTKNIERFEWMAEKVTELGIDRLAPLFGERSERRVLKGDRLRKILLSASKQSLKGAIPELLEPQTVRGFIEALGKPAEGKNGGPGELRLIAYCSDTLRPRASIMEELAKFLGGRGAANGSALPEIIVLIGPEGDFSPEEVRAAMDAGFVPTTLGGSRLRTETAALTAVEAVYLSTL